VIIPSILGITFLATWLAGVGASSLDQGFASWGTAMVETSLVMSMTVNALVMSLIIFKILKVLREVQAHSDQTLGFTAGNTLRTVIFILIESGITLFSFQLARFLVTVVWTHYATYAYELIIGIQEMLNGITPTIILVRVSMGLSFNNVESLESVAESLHCVSASDNSDQEGISDITTDDTEMNIWPETRSCSR